MAEQAAPPDYSHIARARSPGGMLALALTWGSACVLLFGFQALPVITLLLFLAGLPLAYDLLRDSENSFVLTADSLSWNTPQGGGDLLLSAVAHAHLTFRLDLSAKLGLRLRDGRLITVPLSCLPGPHRLERALLDRGIKVVRGRQPLG